LEKLKKDGELLEALARGLAVIEAFDATDSEMTLSQVAQKIDIAPATARRILRTLVALGYVRSINKRFLLSPRILGLSSAYLRSAHVEDALLPELSRLVEKFGDASSVGILEGRSLFYIAHLSYQRSVRPVAGIGVTYPAYPTSMGRVLLAGLSDEELDKYLREIPLKKLTDRTTTDPKKLKSIIRTVRAQGYAAVCDELAYGVTAIAVPIILETNTVIGAVNTSGYSGRISIEDLVDQRLEGLRIAAARIGEMLLRYPTLRHSLEVSREHTTV
jgi:IclR family transcriptional regulator, pca regulon regulatory protein